MPCPRRALLYRGLGMDTPWASQSEDPRLVNMVVLDLMDLVDRDSMDLRCGISLSLWTHEVESHYIILRYALAIAVQHTAYA